MKANFPLPSEAWNPRRRAAATAPRTDAVHGDTETFGARFARRLRDLLIMGVVGPATGVIAIMAIHVATLLQAPPPAPVQATAPAAAPLAAATVAPVSTAVLAPMPLLAPEPTALGVADFGAVAPTPDAREMADWVVARKDNARMPFMVLDKRAAHLYVFHADGSLVDDTAVLLGSAHGDDTYPGIGDVPIADVQPFQRTTAAGRFVTQPGLDIDRTDVVWLDYDAALAMHRVINKVKSERRLQRLASPTPDDNRISYGCINIPIDFFDRNISPVFGKQRGVAYVIPEVKTFAEAFEQGGAAPANGTLTAAARAPRDVSDR